MITKTMGNSLMLDYAAGSLSEPVSLAVATHIAMNPELDSCYQQLNELGGAMLENIEVEDDADLTGLEAIMARLDETDMSEIRVAPSASQRAAANQLPEPLTNYINKPLDELAWKRVTSGVEEYKIPMGQDIFKASLLRVAPGRQMPQHSHRGTEYTVVLDGAYDDGTVCMQAGDFCEADAADLHQPVADAKSGCLCLIVLDAPVKLTGFVGRMINPFLKH